MARLTLTGTIQEIGAVQSFGSNGFTKRDIIVVEEGTKFPNPVKFTLKKDNCAIADNFHEGDKVVVTASINGRAWTNPKTQAVQYFIDLDAYKIEDSSASGSTGKRNAVPPPAVPTEDDLPNNDDEDELPF